MSGAAGPVINKIGNINIKNKKNLLRVLWMH